MNHHRLVWRAALRMSTVIFAALACTATLSPALAADLDQSNTLVIEAEQFQYPSQWQVQESPACLGGKFLLTNGADTDAVTAIKIPAAGTYKIWTRSRCYLSAKEGTRRYSVVINGQAMEKESGLSPLDGWIWEKVGSAALKQGTNVLALHDTARFFGRCDAVLLTTTDTDPSKLKNEQLLPLVNAPVAVEARLNHALAVMPSLARGEATIAATLENNQVRVTFRRAQDTAQKPVIIRRLQVRDAGRWLDVPVADGRESLYLISAPKAQINVTEIFPTWKSDYNTAQFGIDGKMYKVAMGQRHPFLGGFADLLIPRECRQIDAGGVEVTYESAEGKRAVATYQLSPDRRDLRMKVDYRADHAADYSFAFCAFAPTEEKNVQFVELPPVFQFQRNHPTSYMVTSSVLSHPLALVQAAGPDKQSVTCTVAADPQALPFAWAQNNNAAYGFSLRNADGKVQPVIFRPVLGLAGSHVAAGQTVTASWYLLAQPGPWNDSLEYVSRQIFGVRDYRQPWGTSLTVAALNIIDLIKDPVASGWDARLKGFYQIESQNTVSHGAPLPVISAAVLTQDEELYRQRALPTIEYTLSRPIAHYATEEPTSVPRYVKAENTQLVVPSKFFGTGYWQGVDALLGRANPWIAQLAFQFDGNVRWSRGYSAMPKWAEMLGAYRLDPKPEMLERIRKEADVFLKKEMYAPRTGDIDITGFCNVHLYPYWWDLIDLYELTHDRNYLDAAEQGGFYTIASIWAQPMPPEGTIKIHPNNQFCEHPLIWWRNDKKFRLGWPRKPGDVVEQEVPAWLVSNVGMGIEQLTTYYDRQGTRGMQNISMSCWSPHLLRLYQHTGREIFRTYARNGIIGRFTNYPGYYVSGYSNKYLEPRYPYEGPDVTDIYYHHIPAHLGFTLDFLVTEAEQRSNGAIDFPWTKQQGYVWFTNRIFGGGTGKIMNDPAVALRLDRKAVQISSEKINYITGRSRNRYWLVLMNEADTIVPAQIVVNPDAAHLIVTRPYETFGIDGKLLGSKPFTETLMQEVPAKGLVALAFDAKPDETIGRTLPPVRDGHISRDLGETWKQLHAFRIRSPFGKDSLYVVLTGHPKNGAVAKLELDGLDAPLAAVKDNPYEFSVYPWPMDRDMSFRLTLTDPTGKTITTENLLLPGTH